MKTRMHRQRLAIFGAMVALFATGTGEALHAQNLLVNPGFEDTSGLTTAQLNMVTSQGYLPIIPVDSTSLNGWTVVNNNMVAPGSSNLDLVNASFLVHSGNYAIDLVGTGAGSTLGEIQQNVSLTAGSYVLSFWVAHFQGTADANPYLNVSIGGVLAQGVSLPAASGTWQQITIYFNIATTGSYTLDFAALREITSDSGAYLDDMSISVPEASTIWMAGITLALVARFSWKRFRLVRPSRG